MLENYDDILTIEDVSIILGIGKNWVYSKHLIKRRPA